MRVRSSNLDDVLKLFSFAVQRRMQVRESRNQILGKVNRSGHVHHSRENVIARLSAIHLFPFFQTTKGGILFLSHIVVGMNGLL